jgi:hypothetical protein
MLARKATLLQQVSSLSRSVNSDSSYVKIIIYSSYSSYNFESTRPRDNHFTSVWSRVVYEQVPWQNCAENNLDCNGLLLMQLTISIVSSSNVWTLGTTYIEMRVSVCRKQCVKTIPGFFCLTSATSPFRLPGIEGEPSVQMLMHDFHDKSWELKNSPQ